MKRCSKSHQQINHLYFEPPPPLATSPKDWFSYADVEKTGSISQQNIINTVCAYLRPTHQQQYIFIAKSISSICKIFNVYPNDEINLEIFLHCKMEKRILQVIHQYKKKFRPNKFYGSQS